MRTNKTILLTFSALFLTGCGTRKAVTEQSSRSWTGTTKERAKEINSRQTIRGGLKEIRFTLSPPDLSGKQAIESVTHRETVFSLEDSVKEVTNTHTYTEMKTEEKRKKAEKRLPQISLLSIFAMIASATCFIYFRKRRRK